MTTATTARPGTRGQVLQEARSHLGYTERGNNQTIFWAALKPEWQGSPWCAAFVQYCLAKHGVRDLLDGVPLPYYTPSMESWARKNGRWIMSKDAQPGDVLLFTEKATVHTGFLEAQDGANYVVAIEGNTSSGAGGSQTNGDGVYRRRRPRSWIRGAIRMDGLYGTTAAAPTGTPALLTVDGEYGPKSVDALQWYLKIPRDGVMDRMDTREMQTWLSRERTGVLSRDDIKALQGKVSARVDGVWGPNTTVGLQRWLNKRITEAS